MPAPDSRDRVHDDRRLGDAEARAAVLLRRCRCRASRHRPSPCGTRTGSRLRDPASASRRRRSRGAATSRSRRGSIPAVASAQNPWSASGRFLRIAAALAVGLRHAVADQSSDLGVAVAGLFQDLGRMLARRGASRGVSTGVSRTTSSGGRMLRILPSLGCSTVLEEARSPSGADRRGCSSGRAPASPGCRPCREVASHSAVVRFSRMRPSSP